MTDNINSPEHYVKNAITVEPLELTGGLNSCIGQALQYVIRRNDKHPEKIAEELGKAQFMFQWFYENELHNYEIKSSGLKLIICCGVANDERTEVLARLFEKRTKDELVKSVLREVLRPIQSSDVVFESIYELLQEEIDHLAKEMK